MDNLKWPARTNLQSPGNTFDIRSMATTDYGAAEVAEVAEPAKEQQEPFVNLEDTAVPLKLWAAFPMMGMLATCSLAQSA